MQPLKYIPRYTVKDYNLWEGNWELIDGIPHAMSPSPVIKHQRLATALVIQIGNALQNQREKCGSCYAVYEVDWIVDEHTVVRPDIAVVCNNKGEFITTPPALIIEILSPSTALLDRQVKFDIYREQGVKYYLLADPGAKTYSIFQLVERNYVEQKNLSFFTIHDNCGFELDVNKALATLTE